MKLIFATLFLFVQSLAFSAGSTSSVDANKEYLKAEKLIKSYEFEKAIKALSSAEYAASTRAKRKAKKKGKQFSKQPKRIAKKTASYRKYS